MIRAAMGFFIIALVALLFGANGIAGMSMEIGKILLAIFLVLSAISLIIALFTGHNNKKLP